MEIKAPHQSSVLREEIINELEQYSVEVLQSILLLFRLRQAQAPASEA